MLAVILTLSSCVGGNNPQGGSSPSLGGEDSRFTTSDSKIAIFEDSEIEGFWARNDRGNQHPFNCSFSRANAVIANNLLTLSLTKTGTGYAGAEYRSQQRFGYGFYSVKMRAASCPGVISSFFTYTGWPWDEIDIEFLGDDTTRVQFNYFTSGRGNHEYIYELGCDVIVTDHHELPEELPDCILVNPKLKDDYPYDNLCGAGVAFKLACALLGEKAYEYFAHSKLDQRPCHLPGGRRIQARPAHL